MRRLSIVIIIALLLGAPAFAALFNKGTPEEQRNSILKRSEEILQALDKAHPGAREQVEKAYGYATFSDFGIKIFVAGGGRGHGVAVVNVTGEKTFMRMTEIQAGLGFGVKRFMLVWVFENKQAFEKFVNSGWSLGAQGTAALKNGSEGASLQGAVQVAPGIWIYQLTEKGLALELTVKGTKFRKDSKLNSDETTDTEEGDDQ